MLVLNLYGYSWIILPKKPAILYLGRALRAPGSKARSLTTSVKKWNWLSPEVNWLVLFESCAHPVTGRGGPVSRKTGGRLCCIYAAWIEPFSSHFLSFSVFTSCSGTWPWTCRLLIRSLVNALLLAIMFFNFKLFCSWAVPFLYNSNLLLSCGCNSLSNFPKETNFCFLSFWWGVLLLPFLVFLLHLVIFGCPFLFLDGRGGWFA